ncbi:DUF2852 domain-containing protein [Minwuia sp.]|uniref:DUF2852 domain-containing protein n=1 Tax=Minwuia sp. TaxID=2493630 RepID=UPI003A949887
MELAAKLDDYGKPAWITLMIVSFIVFWPIGLAVLGYLIWSGRMGCSKRNFGRWYNQDGSSRKRGFRRGKHQSSGNSAFDEYRDDMLRRLEEEQDEFHTFLDQLRKAKDKAEFDQFMADRGRRSGSAGDGAEASPAG